MLKYIDHKHMGRSRLGWLDSHFHFSFAEYYNPENIQFGILRVVNDDLVESKTGFDMHPHRDMEIVSYVVDGEITHEDSMGNKGTLSRGEVQYMSAGTGVFHSEHNMGNELLRLMQIWIFPDKKGYQPHYGDYKFKLEDRFDKWLDLVTSKSNKKSKAPVKINADANISATILSKGKKIDFKVGKGRQAYLMLLEGKASVNDIKMEARDAMEILEEDVQITAIDDKAHLLVIEMSK